MKKALKIAKWEIRKNLKNKTFLISIILTPLLMVVFGGLPTLLQGLEENSTQNVYIVDELGIFEELEGPSNQSDLNLIEYEGDLGELEQKVVDEPDSSYMVIDEAGIESGVFTMNLGGDGTMDTSSLQSSISKAIQGKRLEELGVDPNMTNYITAEFSVSQKSLLEEDSDFMRKAVPGVFAGLILFSIFITGTMTFQSATQEKRDKMTEVLLSSVRPVDIMQGKIMGYFALGMIQVLLWGTVAGLVATYRFDIAVVQYLMIPEFPLMILYAVMGYLMFSSIFVSMGATINDIYSAGNFQGVIMILPMMPIFFVGAVISNPHGVVAKVGSFFPLSTPGVMLIRLVAASKIPAWEIAATLAILAATTLLAMKLAGKVFKTALLMYGKNATPAEIFRWIRQ